MKYPTLRLGAVASICIILSACGAGSPSHGGSSSSAKRTAPPPPVELVPSTERLFARATGNTLPLSASGAIGSVSVPAAGPRAGQTLITVSGVRFNVSTATIRRGALALTVASLRAGQTVTVNGTLTRGSAVVDADDVIVSAGVVGTVDTIDLTTGSVQVQGQTVHVDDTTTYTGSVGSGSTAAAFTGLDQLAAGNVLDVVGLFNEDGSLQAGAINYVADTFVVDEMTISVTGPVSGLETTAMAFNINAATVDYASAELLDFPVAEDGTPAISDGQIVTVESTAGVNDFGAVVAASVRFVAAPQVTSAAGGAATTVDLLGTNLVLLQGRVTSVSAGGTSIVVNGVTIFVGSAPINRVVATAAGRRSPIAVNALVIVAGRVGANGAFVAEDVSILNGHVPVKLEAPVESYDAETNTLTFLGVVSVAVTDVTLFEDTTIEDIAAALEAGETPTLEVEADFHEDGTLVAHSIELEDGALVDAPVKLRGPAANIDADAQQFDILGVVIVVADETIYVLDGADVPAADFFAALSEAEEPNVKATGAFDGETGEITAAMLSLRTAAADPALNAARKDVARIAGGVPAQSPPK